MTQPVQTLKVTMTLMIEELQIDTLPEILTTVYAVPNIRCQIFFPPSSSICKFVLTPGLAKSHLFARHTNPDRVIFGYKLTTNDYDNMIHKMAGTIHTDCT